MKQCFTHCHSSPHPAAAEHENPTLFTQQSALTEGEDGETGQWWIREQMLLGKEEMERQSAGSVKSLTCLQLNTATGWRREGAERVGSSLVTCPDLTHCAENVGSFLHMSEIILIIGCTVR